MPRRDDAQLKDAAPSLASRCDCDEFRRNQVCDHVLMAAAVRMVHRMIDAQKDENDQKPH
jgi:hypothetical protein